MSNTTSASIWRRFSKFKFRKMFAFLFASAALLVCSQQPATAAGRIINVKNAPYNAVGDGIANDATAIQQAINAAALAPGSTVFFPNGNYNILGGITVSGNQVSLRGFNSRNCILSGGSISISGTNHSLFSITTGPVLLQTSKIAIHSCNFTNDMSAINTTNCQISNCNFVGPSSTSLLIQLCDRVSINNTTFSNSAISVLAASSSNIAIRNSKVEADSIGVYLAVVDTAAIENCNILSSSVGALTAQSNNLTIRNNTAGIPAGITSGVLGIQSAADTNVLIQGNRISNNTYGILTLQDQSGQVIGNSISNCQLGILSASDISLNITDNRISRIQNNGITLTGVAGMNYTIARNTLRDCGLLAADAAISVAGTGFTPTIQTNIYTGNQENIQYFIRCLIPSPPAVVRGNLTTTLLPTVVGP